LVELQNEYVRLFVNSLPTLPCPPYASVYLEGTLMGRSAVGLERLYADYGLQPGDMGDHIAVELEFAGFLDMIRDETPRASEDLRAVLEHLRRWTPELFERVRASDRTGVYAAAARRTAAALDNAEDQR
jgi:TorA maturation chaperone TorD